MQQVYFEFSAHGISYSGTLKYKFNVLMEESVPKKGTMQDRYKYRDDKYEATLIIGDAADILPNLLNGGYESSSYENKILVLDKDCLSMLKTSSLSDEQRAELYERLRKVTPLVLLITRDDFAHLPISYRAIYKWETTNGGKKRTLARLYQDYYELNVAAPRYLCGGSKSSYLYFASKLDNVYSADNDYDVAMQCNDHFVIADGSTFGPYMHKVLTKSILGLYLPISFEYQVLLMLNPKAAIISEPLTYWKCPPYSSLQQLYVSLLNEYCERKYKRPYDKSELQLDITREDITGYLGGLLSLWGKLCMYLGVNTTLKDWEEVLGKPATGDSVREFVQKFIDAQPRGNIDRVRSLLPEIHRNMSDYDIMTKYLNVYLSEFRNSVKEFYTNYRSSN